MNKLLLVAVSILPLVLTGCSFGGGSTGAVSDLTQPSSGQENSGQDVQQNQDAAGQVNEKNTNTDNSVQEQPTENDQQKQQQNSPEEFDPNSYNDQEINELIAMLEGLVEVEQQYE